MTWRTRWVYILSQTPWLQMSRIKQLPRQPHKLLVNQTVLHRRQNNTSYIIVIYIYAWLLHWLDLLILTLTMIKKTLTMMNLSRETSKYIYILYSFSTLWRCWWLKSFFEEDKVPFILHSYYHGWWWPGDVSQGISSYGSDLACFENLCFNTKN